MCLFLDQSSGWGTQFWEKFWGFSPGHWFSKSDFLIHQPQIGCQKVKRNEGCVGGMTFYQFEDICYFNKYEVHIVVVHYVKTTVSSLCHIETPPKVCSRCVCGYL